MAGVPVAPQLPIGFLLVACVACLGVAACRSLGWLRYVLPAGWLAVACWIAWVGVSVSGPGHSAVIVLISGLVPLLGWLRRAAKRHMGYPIPLRELPFALFYPDAHRVISTAATFDGRDSGVERGDTQ